ncbi:hypothetical protein Tfu_2561 [Thermobifida fusca YX]|uniref:Uncharacterized protein n=1 Tax=Thermobifida fusca (strain YX) TaxID=269800 RepID=Q47LS8_THEFY|nr:hypothetical protein Tfu_2561 [Thermobifida fusca YX]
MVVADVRLPSESRGAPIRRVGTWRGVASSIPCRDVSAPVPCRRSVTLYIPALIRATLAGLYSPFSGDPRFTRDSRAVVVRAPQPPRSL